VNSEPRGTPIQIKHAIAIFISALLLGVGWTRRPELIADIVFGKGAKCDGWELAEG